MARSLTPGTRLGLCLLALLALGLLDAPAAARSHHDRQQERALRAQRRAEREERHRRRAERHRLAAVGLRVPHHVPHHEPPPDGELPGGGVGWRDGRPGWNGGEQQVGALRRVPLDGLRSVNWDAAPTPDLPELQRADHRAVVLLHRDLDPGAPVDVLLHLHGFDVGYRQLRGETTRAPVRDLDLHRIEEQVEGCQRPQLLTLLPQGSLNASFAPRLEAPYTKIFDVGALLDEVLERLRNTRLLASRPSVRRLILSAHSGGGEALGAMLEQMQGLGLPVGMVVLLDAINGPREELPRIQRWLQGRLEADLRALRGRSLDEQRRYLASSLRFRAYYTSTSFYTPLHEALNAFLVDWFAQHEGEFGGPEGEALSLWLRNYQVLPADGGHNQLVGAGYLLEALQVLPADGAAGEAGVARR